MAAIIKAVQKEFVRYARERYPEDAEWIIRKADELFPVLYAKAPDIGGKGNAMAYNLDLLILAVICARVTRRTRTHPSRPSTIFFPGLSA